MEWPHVEEFLSYGQAFYPVNSEGSGDVLMILLDNGDRKIVNMSCDTFLKQLLMYYGTSMSASRQRYGYFLGKKQMVPVPLSHGKTLIPFHTREPIGRQSKTGWVIAKEIDAFRKKTLHETEVQLGAHSISVKHSSKFCFEQLKNARWIELCFQELHGHSTQGWNFFQNVRGVYEKV
ncbi:competence protein ComK [Bacillus sp. FJAT-45350]|uniref:competence protein ComK n=1 Tax=Bacillus sp. FJAT-45350 TaxID=2011014 RepID=UPI000BB7B987|nr:competence protein ComK [Bacillus sp. FJAT-45350]